MAEQHGSTTSEWPQAYQNGLTTQDVLTLLLAEWRADDPAFIQTTTTAELDLRPAHLGALPCIPPSCRSQPPCFALLVPRMHPATEFYHPVDMNITTEIDP